MKIAIFKNDQKINEEESKRFVSLLAKNGFETETVSDLTSLSADVLLVLGGDGTILHAVNGIFGQKIFVVGVNFGTLGFLTEFEKDEREELISFLKNLEENRVEKINRTLLEIEVHCKKYHALNEVIFQRDYNAETQILETEVFFSGSKVDTICGDGVLVCTPTGSTAYSLSAGGAILDPTAPVLMLTPVCAFSLNARPVVVSDRTEIRLKAVKTDAVVLVDGKMVDKVDLGEEICVKKAIYTAEFPVRDSSKFFRKGWKNLK